MSQSTCYVGFPLPVPPGCPVCFCSRRNSLVHWEKTTASQVVLWQDPSASAAKLLGISVERRGVCGPVGRRVLPLDACGAPDLSPFWCKWKCLLLSGPQFHPSLLSNIHYPQRPNMICIQPTFSLLIIISPPHPPPPPHIFSYSNPSCSSYLTPGLYTSYSLCNIVLSLYYFT